MRYGMSMLNNLHYIQNNGEKAFLANQNKKYACIVMCDTGIPI